MSKSNAAFRTWAITVRPVTPEDVTYLVEKLNKHPGIQGWWGHQEVVNGDESSRHVHLAIMYPKEVLKFTVTKWLKKTLEHTETWSSGKLQWKAGVCVKIWYDDVWVNAYMDGDQLNSRYTLDDEVIEKINKAYPQKDDTRAVKPTRDRKPQVPDRVVARWHELYPVPPQNSKQIFQFIRYMMYNEKSIGFLDKRKINETGEHVWRMLCEKNDAPIFWQIPAKLKKELLQKVEGRKVADNQGPATTPIRYSHHGSHQYGGRAPKPPAPAAGKSGKTKVLPRQTVSGLVVCPPHEAGAKQTTFIPRFERGASIEKAMQTDSVGLSSVDSDIGVHMDRVIPIDIRTTPAANVDDEVMLVLGHDVVDSHLTPGTTGGLEFITGSNSKPDTS